MNITRLFLLGILTGLAALPAPANSERTDLTEPGAHENVRFSQYPTIAEAKEVLSRVLSPLAVEAVQRRLQASGKAVQTQMFDMGSEEFVIYVPHKKPPAGYGLLVFVPPWPKAEIPPGWSAVLDHYGVILISADRSGNDAEVLERRIPLALAGLANAQTRFPIDPARTLIGGFSGGSRVAMRIALDYPDIFSGVLLNAGSDPIGKNPDHLPSPNLLEIFQTRTRIAFVTGDADTGSQALDASSQSSMFHWCVANMSIRGERGVSHEAASASGLEWAFQALFANARKDTDRLAACRAARREEVNAAIALAERTSATGSSSQARKMLFDLDGKYGGLAASQSTRLADRCKCGVFDAAQSGAKSTTVPAHALPEP